MLDSYLFNNTDFTEVVQAPLYKHRKVSQKMYQSNELSLKREMHYACRTEQVFMHIYIRNCVFQQMSYFHTKSRLSVLKELCVNQAEEQRILRFDLSFVEQKDCKYCIK